jgi:hypothetical protein
LLQVFGKHGVVKFESLDKPFDPNMHTALFQMPDPSKPCDTVGAVLKVRYEGHFIPLYLQPQFMNAKLLKHDAFCLSSRIPWGSLCGLLFRLLNIRQLVFGVLTGRGSISQSSRN